MMNKRSSSGGGQSSLGYLFGSDDLGKQQYDQSKVSPPPVCMPPYGTDDTDQKSPEKALTPITKKGDSTSPKKYIYHGDGNKSKEFLVTVSLFIYALSFNQIFLTFYGTLTISYDDMITGPTIDKGQLSSWWRFISWLLVWR